MRPRRVAERASFTPQHVLDGRSIYGRVFRLLQIIRTGPLSVDKLSAAVRSDPIFLLQREKGGTSKYVSSVRPSAPVAFNPIHKACSLGYWERREISGRSLPGQNKD
jgi:hypothetical protein